MTSDKKQLTLSLLISACVDPEELLVASDLIESSGFEDSAELLRQVYANIRQRHSETLAAAATEESDTPLEPRQTVLQFFNVGRIAQRLGESMSGIGQRQVRELAIQLENWLVANGVTESNARQFTLEQVNRPNAPVLVFLLHQKNGSLVGEISIEKPICGY
ncbi:MAG: hypothetical protein SFV81_23620 [Pirellulaceae bacterium]|nr:hypothetical protein [Pirellulaceae bacterium]